jgi:hypothetical protein
MDRFYRKRKSISTLVARLKLPFILPPAARKLFIKSFLDFQKFFIKVFFIILFACLRGLQILVVDLDSFPKFDVLFLLF